MNVEFTGVLDHKTGTLVGLLQESYAPLLEGYPYWQPELRKWEEYDQEVFTQPGTVGACVFLTKLGGHLVGFASWDPRQRPEYGIVGHNCILPAFRGKGLGRQQIQEILRRLQRLGIKAARVTTHNHPFFVPAQRMYLACGFREVRRIPWDRDPNQKMIEYEKELGPQ